MPDEKLLLLRGQTAEWVVLSQPTEEERKSAWLLKCFIEREALPIQDGLLCGGPGCEEILRPGARALLVTDARHVLARKKEKKLWFCSIACQRRNHLEVLSRRKRRGGRNGRA